MPRPKKNREESDIVVFSFGVDRNDPKYHKLISMLEEIDSGARSFIIRQILNHYVNSQGSAPLFGLITNSLEPTSTNSSSKTKREVTDEKSSISTYSSSSTVPLQQTEQPSPMKEKPEITQPKQDELPKKPKNKHHLGLKALANQFN